MEQSDFGLWVISIIVIFMLYFTGEVMLKYKGDHSYLYNVKTGTVPIVIHGNGPIKVGLQFLKYKYMYLGFA